MIKIKEFKGKKWTAQEHAKEGGKKEKRKKK